jgi:hypothetical protein
MNTFSGARKMRQKIRNTGIEIEQCRYLYFMAKRLIWPAKFPARFVQGFPAAPQNVCVCVPATSDQSARRQSHLRLAIEMALGLLLKTAKNQLQELNSCGQKGKSKIM